VNEAIMPERSLVLFGAGGHAKVVIDTVRLSSGLRISFLAEKNQDRVGGLMYSYPILSQDEVLRDGPKGDQLAFISIGDNGARRDMAGKAEESGFSFSTLIHPSAVVSKETQIGAGTLLTAGVVLNPYIRVGNHVIVNSGAVVEHDCVLGDYVHLAPRSTLCGGVIVGSSSLVGAGAVVLPGVTIGKNVVVGAGVVVSKDVPDGIVLRRSAYSYE
jgi:sugar O-acyltransferase (sialic acid O-acetyltransferase NeuD family)